MISFLIIWLFAMFIIFWAPAIIAGGIVGKKYYGSAFKGVCVGFVGGWIGVRVLRYLSRRREL